jgi:hypothetical protein
MAPRTLRGKISTGRRRNGVVAVHFNLLFSLAFVYNKIVFY